MYIKFYSILQFTSTSLKYISILGVGLTVIIFMLEKGKNSFFDIV